MAHFIELSDGRVIGSGGEGAAVRSVRITASMGADRELNPGGVCASVLDLSLFPGDVRITAGDKLILYDGNMNRLGIFYAQNPKLSGGLLEVTAQDVLCTFDRDVTDWLQSLTFPMSLVDLTAALGAHFGVAIRGTVADYAVPAFSARGITGRQLLQWIAQACGCFCAADPEGNVELRWLRHRNLTLGTGGEHFCYQGTLTLSDYACAAVDQIHIGLTDSDTGIRYPDSGANALSIRGNYLLTGDNSGLVRSLADALCGFSYTPCRFETATALEPGDVFTLEGRTCVAMTVEYGDGRYRVSATGSPSREGSAALCGSGFQALNGRILELQWELQGVEVEMTEFRDTSKAVSRLSQDVDRVEASVSELTQLQDTTTTRLTELKVTSDALEVTVGNVESALNQNSTELRQMTERFRFDADGLTISDSATGMAIRVSQAQIAFTGTTVIRPDNLDTTNLYVGESLTLGDFVYIPRTNGNLSFRWIGESV